MRKSYGAFKSVNDLMAIRGIGPKRLEKMRKYLAVGKPATPVAPTKSVAAWATKKTPPPQPSSTQPPTETEEP